MPRRTDHSLALPGFLLLPLLSLVACQGGAHRQHDALIAETCAHLWTKQAADGGWHSEVYGVLREGDALSGFVLATLLEVPREIYPRDPASIDAAVAFLCRRVDAGGAVGRDELVPDYPNYASAHALLALGAAGGQAATLRRLRTYLVGQQFREATGWPASHPAYGGFGMGGEVRLGPGDPGHVDLSMTRVVLQALAAASPPPRDCLVRARRFVDRCAAPGGGFSFSPVLAGLNKAGPRDGGFAGYGSSTADGILALLATGVPRTDPRLQRAAAPLIAGHRLDRVPGIPLDAPLQWSRALRFYYLAVSAQAFAALGVDQAPVGHDWRHDLGEALRRDRRADGSWSNPVGSVKEDDPIIATTLALQALLAARRID